tara:strand:+ start:331 stop:1050 length:720 start_codon:yes stop_codon:yes gene_type:complete
MGIHIITFATHSSGKFEKLKDDLKKNNIELNVIGWGTKWECYLKKLENTIENINNYNDDDILVVIDGFDTEVSGNFCITELEKIYKTNFNDNIVVSLDPYTSPLPKILHNYLHNRIFGGPANAGMYMGTKKHLMPFLKDVMKDTTSKRCKNDDQCGINLTLNKYNNVTIDYDKLIFNNIDKTKNDKNKGMFYGYPLSFTYDRILRIPKDYSKFLITEILFLVLLIIMFFTYKVTYPLGQ